MIDPNHPRSETTHAPKAPTGVMPDTLLARLRRATVELHESVERLPLMAALTAPTVTRADYRRYLARMTQVYGTLEPPLFAALDARLAAHPELVPALLPKLPALLVDCRAEGLEVPPTLTPTQRHYELGAALGGLYVLEGATLGGRVIARHLRRQLGNGLGAPAFLDFHGEGTSSGWKAFGVCLERLTGTGVIVPDQVISGACAVFREVYRILGLAQDDAMPGKQAIASGP